MSMEPRCKYKAARCLSSKPPPHCAFPHRSASSALRGTTSRPPNMKVFALLAVLATAAGVIAMPSFNIKSVAAVFTTDMPPS